MQMCIKQADEKQKTLHVVTRRDKRGLLEHWRVRMEKLQGLNKPHWSSSSNRYCTSDLKRDVIDSFFRNVDCNLIISAEGIRAQESTARSKKIPLEIRSRISSSFYKGMTVEKALMNYRPDKRLALTYYPIFNWSIQDVWRSGGNTVEQLEQFRKEYEATGIVNAAWNFHPAYVFGNDRVSCMICILGSLNDIKNGVKHNRALAEEIASMEDESGFSFRQGLSIKSLL